MATNSLLRSLPALLGCRPLKPQQVLCRRRGSIKIWIVLLLMDWLHWKLKILTLAKKVYHCELLLNVIWQFLAGWDLKVFNQIHRSYTASDVKPVLIWQYNHIRSPYMVISPYKERHSSQPLINSHFLILLLRKNAYKGTGFSEVHPFSFYCTTRFAAQKSDRETILQQQRKVKVKPNPSRHHVKVKPWNLESESET